MRVLILGGTRFLGLRVAEVLLNLGHDLVVLSRRPGGAPVGACHICADREIGLAKLEGSYFDLVLDFICYDDTGLYQISAYIHTHCYVLISSTWLPRLWAGGCAVELALSSAPGLVHIPKVSFKYLRGKLLAEHALFSLRETGCNAVSLRLPIILGAGDHTGRYEFYLKRLLSGGPLILVDGGHNFAQIAVMEDVAQAIVCWVTQADISMFQVWEALPDAGRSVRAIMEGITAAAGVRAQLIDVPMADLERDFPIYLDREPLWRESSLPITSANIYAAVGIVPAIFGQEFFDSAPSYSPLDDLRKEEFDFLAKRRAA